MSHIIEWTRLWRACPDHEMECRLVEKIQREATKAALEKAAEIAESEANHWRGLDGSWAALDAAKHILNAIRALIEEAP